jgi:hypothetical protein
VAVPSISGVSLRISKDAFERIDNGDESGKKITDGKEGSVSLILLQASGSNWTFIIVILVQDREQRSQRFRGEYQYLAPIYDYKLIAFTFFQLKMPSSDLLSAGFEAPLPFSLSFRLRMWASRPPSFHTSTVVRSLHLLVSDSARTI